MRSKPPQPKAGFRRAAMAVALLAALLTGCTSTDMSPEPVTITFTYPEPDNVYYEDLAAVFSEAHPHITVELLPRPLRERSTVDLAEVDVLTDGMIELDSIRDELLELNPFVDHEALFDTSDMYAGTIEALSNEGKTWAVPAGMDLYVMYYSRDLFDQRGVQYPEAEWTWDEFLNTALALNDPDAGTFGYITTPEHLDAVVFVYQHGGHIVDDTLNPSQMTFDDPLTVDALIWYAKLFHEYDVAPTPAETRAAFGGSAYAAYQGILSGKVGMWALSLSEQGGLMWPVEWLMNWGMAPLPQGAQPATVAWVEGYAISGQTEYPDECWQWVAFLSNQMHHRLVPARRSLVESQAYEQLVGEEVAEAVRVSAEHAVLLSPQIWTEFQGAMDGFGAAIDGIVAGDLAPLEAMVELQREYER